MTSMIEGAWHRASSASLESLDTQVDDGTSLAGIPEIKESAACITV